MAMSRRILMLYYAATALFLALDYGFDINVRVAFLETMPGFRLAYYGVCFACLALMIWRPAWTTAIGVVESLATLIALIFNMALRSIVVTDQMLETGVGFVTMPELANFLLAGSAAYFAYARGVNELASQLRSD